MAFPLNPWFWVTLLGTPELWLGLALGMGFVYFLIRERLGRKRRPLKAFLIVFIASLLLTFAVVQGVKGLTHIPRPCGQENPYCENDFSFPSGHSAAAFVVFTAFLLSRKRPWVLALLPLPALVAYSRVALGVHAFPDIVAGSAAGVLVTIFVWKAVRMKKLRAVWQERI